MPLSIPAAAISVALRQSAAFLGARGLCLARHALDGSVLVLAKEGDVGDDDAITAALAAHRGALPGAGTAAWVGAAPFGSTGHVLLAFSDFPLDEGALGDATELVRALVHEQSPEIALDPVRFVGDLASDSSPLPELLDTALQRALRVLDLDAAVLLCVEAEAWDVEAICDPADILDLDALLETDGLATMTYRSSGAVGLHDVAGSSFAEARGVGAYLGAPIVSGRNGLGVLAFVARDPRDEPFAAEYRDLVQMLARWAGIALGAQVARRKLRASEASLQRIVDGTPHPVALAEWIVAAGLPDDLVVTSANDPAAHLLGVGDGDRLSEVLPPATLRLWTAACRRALVEGTPQPFRTEVVPPGAAEPRQLAVTLGLVSEPEGDRPARVTFLAEDITSRHHLRTRVHEREAQLRALLEATPVILFELDEAGVFTFAEGRGLALSGLRSGDLVGQSVYERYRFRPSMTQSVGRVLAGEPASWSLKFGPREFDVMALPAYDRDGHIAGARGVAMDVTERNAARQSADAAQAEASEDARHSADLMALLSHGLRVPLATILGFADLLEAEADHEASEAGGAISRAAGEVLETLDGFLDLSQLSALRTTKPSPIGAAGLRAALHTALAEGSAGTPATLDFDEPAHPLVLNLGLLRAVVRRLAVLASGSLLVRAEISETHLLMRFESEGIGERLASDSLHTAYVYHAATALDADLALDGDHIVGLGVPVTVAPVVDLGPPQPSSAYHAAAA